MAHINPCTQTTILAYDSLAACPTGCNHLICTLLSNVTNITPHEQLISNAN